MVNSTGDPANEYFSDGMSEEFISSLSRLHDLKVIGRTSSFQFKGKTDDSKTIGEKLGVYYLLEGSVRKSADRVRIAVALIKSGDGANVWSETYDRELKDIFAVQSEIAGAVAKELKVALLGNNGQTAQLATAATPSNQNVEAYNALLQGNFYSNRRTAEDTRKAIGYYEEAIRLDPRYALAYAKLSIAAVNLATNYGSLATKERARGDRKSPCLGEERARSGSESRRGAFGTRLRFCSISISISPPPKRNSAAPSSSRRRMPAVTANLASLLADSWPARRSGRARAAGDCARSVTQRESTPTSRSISPRSAATTRPRRRCARPSSCSRSPPRTTMRLAIIQILRGNSGAAVELAKQETDPFWRTYALALAHFANGDRAEADAALKKLIDEDADDAGSQIAAVYALRKEPEKMFEWLEHAWTTHDTGVTELLTDPFLRAYKDDPRFIAFAQKIGVMPKAAANP